MAKGFNTKHAHPGDWVEARGIHGESPRRGEIVDVVGPRGHQRFRVRWDEEHESIVYPADGVTIVPHRSPRARDVRGQGPPA